MQHSDIIPEDANPDTSRYDDPSGDDSIQDRVQIHAEQLQDNSAPEYLIQGPVSDTEALGELSRTRDWLKCCRTILTFSS